MTRSPVSLRFALLTLCALAAAGVYLNSLANGFALDDVYIIEQNTRVHDLRDWRAVWLSSYWPFFGIELGLYRPFAIFAYAVQWTVGGGSALWFHVTSMLLHAAVTVLCFLLLEKLTSAIPAFVGALIFAVHPVHTEAVANIVGQAELIAGAAMLGACLVHATRPAGTGVAWPRRLALLLLFMIALATKESAIVLPGLLVITDFAQRRVQLTLRGLANYADDMLMPILLLGLGLACYLLVRLDVLEGTLTGVNAAPQMQFLREEHRVFNALRAFPEFFRLLFFPQDLAADYGPAVVLPVTSVTVVTALGALLLVGLMALALTTPWLPAIGLPAAWFIITIVTVSNLFFPIGVLIAERTLYLPSFAVSALLAFGWAAGAPRATLLTRRVTVGVVVVAALALGARTWMRNPDWKSTPTVLNSMIRDHPESYKAQWVHATWDWNAGRIESARYHFELAYRIYSRDSEFLRDYANFLLSDGQPERAVALLEEAYRMDVIAPLTVGRLALTYLAVQRYEDAWRVAREAWYAGLDPAIAVPIMAYAAEGLGDRNGASAAWRVAMRHTKLNNWITWAVLARTLALSGFEEESRIALARARATARDTLATGTVARMQEAVHDGCYRTPASLGEPGAFQSLGGTVIRVPACDPLSTVLSAEAAAQNANPLHNARLPEVEAPAPGPVGTS